MARCPYCGRRLVKTERYCWFCEEDVSKVIDEEERPKLKEISKRSFESLSDKSDKKKK